ncbi:UDP-galactopyranose mutase [Clostridioides sp. ES-S-0123-01]|uniref:UDP-galactopyranose mutase n=1 Tax=Clostridioides sp. ES-S-0123-01 TaxID=2770783 RepID=UPI001D10E84F|nr:UDP-galactopyranose mutase [Clostridioides sp. ES-S-0123-01]
MYDCVIVGAGFCGAVIARKIAEELDKNVLVIERRNHIAGNAYDELNDIGILVQKYGPHIFHTDSEEVYNFILKYSKWNDYKLKCEVVMDGKNTPSPFNFDTIEMFFDEDEAKLIKENIKLEYPDKNKATIVEMLESNNYVVRNYAEFLFKKDYSLYTSKQWGILPKDIDINVLKRVPVRFDYVDMYFDNKYECLPKDGYTVFFDNLLNHKNIELVKGVNALEHISINNNRLLINGIDSLIPVVFTGAIDELLEYKYGKLPYRSLYFKYEIKEVDSFQNAPVVAYPQVKDYTRITEYTKLPYQDAKGKTTIAYEFPIQFDNEKNGIEPYYPIINDENQEKYNKYLEHVKKIENLFLCGRLADYKYYNMDNAIERAFYVYSELKRYMLK